MNLLVGPVHEEHSAKEAEDRNNKKKGTAPASIRTHTLWIMRLMLFRLLLCYNHCPALTSFINTIIICSSRISNTIQQIHHLPKKIKPSERRFFWALTCRLAFWRIEPFMVNFFSQFEDPQKLLKANVSPKLTELIVTKLYDGFNELHVYLSILLY